MFERGQLAVVDNILDKKVNKKNSEGKQLHLTLDILTIFLFDTAGTEN